MSSEGMQLLLRTLFAELKDKMAASNYRSRLEQRHGVKKIEIVQHLLDSLWGPSTAQLQ